jgi:hypothetical protein
MQVQYGEKYPLTEYLDFSHFQIKEAFKDDCLLLEATRSTVEALIN